MVENRGPVNSRWLCLMETTTSASIIISCLSSIEADHAIMHTNELPMFVYNLWISYLSPHHVNNCVQLSTSLRCATISNTLMCTLHDFPVVKLGLFIRALLLDHNLALEKNTRTFRVHLILIFPIVVSVIFFRDVAINNIDPLKLF